MQNIRCKISECIEPLNQLYKGLGDLVFKNLKEKQKNHRLSLTFKRFGKFPEFSKNEYKLSTLVFHGTTMTGEYKKIYKQLIEEK